MEKLILIVIAVVTADLAFAGTCRVDAQQAYEVAKSYLASRSAVVPRSQPRYNFVQPSDRRIPFYHKFVFRDPRESECFFIASVSCATGGVYSRTSTLDWTCPADGSFSDD